MQGNFFLFFLLIYIFFESPEHKSRCWLNCLGVSNSSSGSKFISQALHCYFSNLLVKSWIRHMMQQIDKPSRQ